MNTKQIIDEMEKELNKFFDQKYPRVERWQYDGYIDTAVPFIHSYTRKLIESLAEEIVGENESEEVGYGVGYEQSLENEKRNDLRAEQRLKVKEIINQISK